MLQAAPISEPSCPQESDGIYVPTRLDTLSLHSLTKHDQNVDNFVCNSKWVVPGPYSSLGTSWLELLIAYISQGGTLQCSERLLHTPSYHQCVKEFRARVRRMIALALPPEHHCCFQPYGVSFIRLRPLRIATLVPGVQGRVCMSDDMRSYVSTVLVAAAHKVSLSRAEHAVRRTLPFHPTRFPMRQRVELVHLPPKFGNNVSCLARACEPLPILAKPAFLHFVCPQCSASQDVANRRLHGSAGWSSLLCKRCGKTSRARLWKCVCGIPWTTCPTHQPHGYACVGNKTSSALRQRAVKDRSGGQSSTPRFKRQRFKIVSACRLKTQSRHGSLPHVARFSMAASAVMTKWMGPGLLARRPA